jgi:hypothetical protein
MQKRKQFDLAQFSFLIRVLKIFQGEARMSIPSHGSLYLVTHCWCYAAMLS